MICMLLKLFHVPQRRLKSRFSHLEKGHLPLRWGVRETLGWRQNTIWSSLTALNGRQTWGEQFETSFKYRRNLCHTFQIPTKHDFLWYSGAFGRASRIWGSSKYLTKNPKNFKISQEHVLEHIQAFGVPKQAQKCLYICFYGPRKRKKWAFCTPKTVANYCMSLKVVIPSGAKKSPESASGLGPIFGVCRSVSTI